MKPIANTILVQDVSGSMNESLRDSLTKLEALKQANLLLLEHKRRNYPFDRIGCVLFNNTAWRLFDLTKPKDPTIESRLNSIQAGGQTNMQDGLRMAIDMLTARMADSCATSFCFQMDLPMSAILLNWFRWPKTLVGWELL